MISSCINRNAKALSLSHFVLLITVKEIYKKCETLGINIQERKCICIPFQFLFLPDLARRFNDMTKMDFYGK